MIAPPRTAERLLAALGAEPAFRDAVLGDLAEELALRAARDGVHAARRWYLREAARAAPHLLHDWARHLHARGLARLGGVVLGAYALLLLIALLVAAPVWAMVAALGGAHPELVASPRPLASLGGLAWAALALGGVATVLGGFLAAWLDDRAPMASALAFGVAWACVNQAVAALAGGVPAWLRVGTTAVLLAGTALGGVLRVRAAGGQSRLRPRG